MSDPFNPKRKVVSTTTVNMGGVSVMLGMPAGRDLPILTVKSIMGTMTACSKRGIPFEFGAVAHSAVVQWARDEVIDMFLKSDCNVLFWIDSDMVWEPGHFLRFLVWTQLYDVVCGAYPAKLDRTTFYLLRDEPVVRNEHGLLPINGVGLGFVAMRRNVVEK